MYKKGFQMMWWYQLLSYGILMLFSALSAVVIHISGADVMQGVALLSELVLIIPCIAGYFLFVKGADGNAGFKELGFRPLKPEYILYILLMPALYQIFCVYMTMPLTLGLNALFGSDTPDIEMPKNAFDCVLTVFSLCIAAPLLEEFIYRGVMVRMLKGYSFQTVMLTTSLAFAMMHMDMSGFVQIFFLGMLLFVLRYVTDSIFASMTAHAIVNFTSFMSMIMMEKDVSGLMPVILAVEIGSLVIIPFLLVNFLKTADETERWTRRVSLKGKKAGVSAGCIIFVAIFVLWNIGILIGNIESGYVSDSIGKMFEDNGSIYEEGIN